MGVSFVSLAFVSATRGAGAGKVLFNVYTDYAFGLCLLAGVLLTADALAEEKRDGTLGLLFLTDLRGYDVVIGKLAACSLTALYCLLALLPMTVLPMLAGGVTASDVWRMAIALLNALFFSLAVGLFISACGRDSQRALGNALGLVLLLAAALPALASLGTAIPLAPVWQKLAWVSPFSAFNAAVDVSTTEQAQGYWHALGACHLLAWSFLALASVVLPRCWQQRFSTGGRRGFWLGRGRGSAARRQRLRAKLLPAQPVAWLASGELGVQWGAWLIVAAWAVVVIGAILWWPGSTDPTFLSGYGMAPPGFCLKVLFALQACRFFAEGRRNGALELLLCTPLTNRDILSGQIRALWRAFFWPVFAFIVLSFVPTAVYIGEGIAKGELDRLFGAGAGLFFSGVNVVRLTVDLAAVCWFGMGLALTMRQPNLAPAVTIISVLILPSFLCWLDIVPAFILMAVGLSKCQRDLRHQLSGQYRSVG